MRNRPEMPKLFALIIFASLAVTAFSNVAYALVDASAPNLDLILSDGRPLVNGTVIGSISTDIVCLAVDELSGIQSVKYSIDGGAFKNTNNLGDLHRTTISLTGTDEGVHTLTVRATNSVNLTAEMSVSFSLDLGTTTPVASNIVWIIVTAVVGVSGFLVAVFLILLERKKQVKAPSEENIVLDPNQPFL